MIEQIFLWSSKYCITFIDDFLHYCYFYILHKKSQLVDIFTVFIDGVERQLNRKVKIIIFVIGGEYREK